MVNVYWLWAGGILFFVLLVMEFMKMSWWIKAATMVACLMCWFGFLFSMVAQDAKQIRQFNTSCMDSGGKLINSVENGWNRVRCIKPDYNIVVPTQEDYCATHGGQYLNLDNDWTCVKKDHLIDIKIK